jgi:magnesium-protoporphyrin IX monomethyl ester (oxidative) cyclase
MARSLTQEHRWAVGRHVIIETNKTTARIFSEVPDCEAPQFWEHMENLITLNQKLIAVGQTDAPDVVKNLQRVPIIAGFASELLQLFFCPTLNEGSADVNPEVAVAY